MSPSCFDNLRPGDIVHYKFPIVKSGYVIISYDGLHDAFSVRAVDHSYHSALISRKDFELKTAHGNYINRIIKAQ